MPKEVLGVLPQLQWWAPARGDAGAEPNCSCFQAQRGEALVEIELGWLLMKVVGLLGGVAEQPWDEAEALAL